MYARIQLRFSVRFVLPEKIIRVRTIRSSGGHSRQLSSDPQRPGVHQHGVNIRTAAENAGRQGAEWAKKKYTKNEG